MFAWFEEHQALFYWLTGASVVLFLASLVAVPFMLIRLPPDYFADQTHPPRARKVPLALRIAKNVLGGVMILAGVIMLALPGQGVLAILAGVLLTDFPGKYRFARWIVSRRRVLGAINWLRKKARREPLQVKGAHGARSKRPAKATKSARRAA